jgi:ABC-2 type transport system permease protein
MTATDAAARALAIENEPLQEVGQKTGFFSGTGGSLRDIWSHHELLGLLVRRELKARYKDSSLGIVWSLFRPLAQLLIYYLAIGKVLGASRGTPDFAIFVFVGLTMWGLFAEIITGSTTSILSNSGLVKKVYLPREIFPLSAIGGALFNFCVQLVVLAIAIVVLASVPFDFGPQNLLAPLAIVTLVTFATAVGLVLSAINVYLRDAQHLVEIAILILFWASPIVYSFTYVNNLLHGNWLEQLYLANPVTIAVISMQKALWAAGSLTTGPVVQTWPPHLAPRLFITLAVSLILLWLAQRIFSRLQGNFAQEL